MQETCFAHCLEALERFAAIGARVRGIVKGATQHRFRSAWKCKVNVKQASQQEQPVGSMSTRKSWDFEGVLSAESIDASMDGVRGVVGQVRRCKHGAWEQT